MSAHEPAFLTVPQVARELQLSPQTVARRIREGRIPAVAVGGTKKPIYRVPRVLFEAYCAGTWKPSPSPQPVDLIARRVAS